MRLHELIKKPVTKSYKNDLIRLSDILFKMSEFVKNRQIVDCAVINHHDINHVNKVLKTNLDYKKVTSINFVIEDKQKAQNVGTALFILSELIKNNDTATLDDSTLFRQLNNIGIEILEISLSASKFYNQSEYVVYENMDNWHKMRAIEHGVTRHYLMSYQYDVMSKSEQRKYDNHMKKVRKKAAKKAAETRKKNKLEAERKEKERKAWEQKHLELKSDKVNQLKQQINDYIEKNPDSALFIDTETTSLGYGRKVVQIAIVDEDENIILNTLCDYFDVEITKDATEIHGITKADLSSNGIRLHLLEAELTRLFNNREVVFYNYDFDILAIYNSLSRDFKFTPLLITDVMIKFAPVAGEWVDWAESYRWQKLIVACRHYDIEYNNAHDALADAIATARVYKAMFECNDFDF